MERYDAHEDTLDEEQLKSFISSLQLFQHEHLHLLKHTPLSVSFILFRLQ